MKWIKVKPCSEDSHKNLFVTLQVCNIVGYERLIHRTRIYLLAKVGTDSNYVDVHETEQELDDLVEFRFPPSVPEPGIGSW